MNMRHADPTMLDTGFHRQRAPLWNALLSLPLLLCLSPPAAQGQETLIAYTTALSPLQQQAANGRVYGTTVSMLEAILARAGIEAKVALHPWSYSYQQTKAQANALIFSMMRTAERERRFQWIGALINATPSQVMSIKERDIPANLSLEQLKDYRICAQQSAGFDYMQAQGFVVGKDLFPITYHGDNLAQYLSSSNGSISQRDWIELLQSSHCDAVLALPLNFSYRLQTRGLSMENFTINYTLPGEIKPLYLAANLHMDAKTIEALQQSFSALKQAGVLYQICQQSLGRKSPLCGAVIPSAAENQP